jgi:hypothetical protein
VSIATFVSIGQKRRAPVWIAQIAALFRVHRAPKHGARGTWIGRRPNGGRNLSTRRDRNCFTSFTSAFDSAESSATSTHHAPCSCWNESLLWKSGRWSVKNRSPNR